MEKQKYLQLVLGALDLLPKTADALSFTPEGEDDAGSVTASMEGKVISLKV